MQRRDMNGEERKDQGQSTNNSHRYRKVSPLSAETNLCGDHDRCLAAADHEKPSTLLA
jgi:hypothetical protein